MTRSAVPGLLIGGPRATKDHRWWGHFAYEAGSPLLNFHCLPSRASSPVLPDQPSDTAQGVGKQKGTPWLQQLQKAAHILSSTTSHYPKGSAKPGARFNPTRAPSPFTQFTFGEYKGKAVNVSLTKPENPAGSYLTAYISITLLLNICIGGKSRFAWRDLFKAVTEPFLPVTVLYQHPNGTANILMGKVEWNY